MKNSEALEKLKEYALKGAENEIDVAEINKALESVLTPQKALNVLRKAFVAIDKYTFENRCAQIRDDCNGCNNTRSCVKGARVVYWLTQYRKTLIKYLEG